nr:unnamed protein product [Callosobruchus chinensis]
MAGIGMQLRRRLTPEEKLDNAKKAKVAKETEYKRRESRPFLKYPGKVIYHTEMVDVAFCSDKLLTKANESADLMIIGFDLEWPFSFQTGPGKVAVIQISPDLTDCYVFHVSNMKNLPKALSEFLAHDKVRLTGNNIKNDVRKLARDFAGFNVEKMIDNCIDLGVMANTILPTTQRWSLEKLVDHLLDLKINKDKKIRQSKWHIIPLSNAQKKYAAIDAYVSLCSELFSILFTKKTTFFRHLYCSIKNY